MVIIATTEGDSMRLLKVKVDGAELFKNCLFELDSSPPIAFLVTMKAISLTSRPFARSLPSTRKMLSAWLALMRRARPPRSISSALFWLYVRPLSHASIYAQR